MGLATSGDPSALEEVRILCAACLLDAYPSACVISLEFSEEIFEI